MADSISPAGRLLNREFRGMIRMASSRCQYGPAVRRPIRSVVQDFRVASIDNGCTFGLACPSRWSLFLDQVKPLSRND